MLGQNDELQKNNDFKHKARETETRTKREREIHGQQNSEKKDITQGSQEKEKGKGERDKSVP